MALNPTLPTEDITLYDFMFNRSFGNNPWFLDAITGEARTGADLKERVDALALGLQKHLGLSYASTRRNDPNYTVGPVFSLVSTNDVDFGTVIWASHLLGATVAPSNAGGTIDELTHQLRLSGAQVIFAHPTTLERSLTAAHAVGIKDECVIVLARGRWVDLYSEGVHVAKTYTVDDRAEALYTIDELIGVGKSAASQGAIIRRAPLNSTRPRVAFLCFSSGTTGLPKAVVMPHRAVIANVLQVSAFTIPRECTAPGDKSLGVIPLSHIYGLLTLVHLCPYLGITSTLFQSLPPFEKFLNILGTLKISHLFLAPPLINAFIKHPAAQGRDFSYFKSCLVAAAPLDAEREIAFRALAGPELVLGQVFGMTETGGLTGLPVGEKPVSGSVGRLLPLTDAKITDPEGNVVGIGRRGELRIKGPQLCLGYLDNESATVEAFDSGGYLMRSRCARQIIKTKGFQISPAELEGHLFKHPFVKDVGVVGKPDECAGELPVAFVVLSDAGQEAYRWGSGGVKDAIKTHVREHKSEYKWLGDVIFLETIPKLPSGKIVARELKTMFYHEKSTK
ncbi:uncharacterized protein EI90DRAFT_3280444 [Cantharellus anzutake]|uniref:uncharacterized protein n=1 Tax=Cantharellus anzutake TaxID=1750568 RepID=UPI001903EB7F|nr:uncharacterized protein EI90DRAFT_3280444 [Cantharellus anzutake]KAF8333616.1 hypothetical protein EI90DRAFT_3280444 [Cantharellus anzutake]